MRYNIEIGPKKCELDLSGSQWADVNANELSNSMKGIP
jgi:hypothetical protein